AAKQTADVIHDAGVIHAGRGQPVRQRGFRVLLERGRLDLNREACFGGHFSVFCGDSDEVLSLAADEHDHCKLTTEDGHLAVFDVAAAPCRKRRYLLDEAHFVGPRCCQNEMFSDFHAPNSSRSLTVNRLQAYYPPIPFTRRMTMKYLRTAGLSTALLTMLTWGSESLLAHHSFAMFDTAKSVTITGTVSTFEWTNPHAYIEVDTADATGAKHWSVEMGSPSILMQGGWKFKDLKHGD